MDSSIYLVIEFKCTNCTDIYDERSRAYLTYSESNALKLYQKYREDLLEHKDECKQYMLLMLRYDFDIFADRLEDFVEASGNQKAMSDAFYRFGKETSEEDRRKYEARKAIFISESGEVFE